LEEKTFIRTGQMGLYLVDPVKFHTLAPAELPEIVQRKLTIPSALQSVNAISQDPPSGP
jgi:hypothetical protein